MTKSSKKEKSKYLVAAAGAGKTTYLVEAALETPSNKQVLITTFTNENENEIRKKFIQKNKSTPPNVTIMTWWSFLLKHGVKPYQNALTEKKINGLNLVNKQSSLYCPEHETDKHYFTDDYRIYSDKIAKFVIRCDEKMTGTVFNRLSNIFDWIYVDEAQDMAGYDLEIIKQIILKTNTVLVGDPRQVTYKTHHAPKYKQYRDGKLKNFFEKELKEKCDVIEDKLCTSFRCNQKICDLSGSLFPNLPQVLSENDTLTEHDGIFLVHPTHVASYLNNFSPIQLRASRANKKIMPDYPVYNFGESKGLTFDRVLIYPTKPITDYLLENKELPFSSLCKFYVALTRARYSAAIVWNAKKYPKNIQEIWSPEN